MTLLPTISWRRLLLSILLGGLFVLPSSAQYPSSRPSTQLRPTLGDATGRGPEGGQRSVGRTVEIKRLIGVGRQTLVQTPEFRTSVPKSATRPKDWVQILVEYDSYPEWIDRLTFQYTVLSVQKEDGQQRLTLYRRTVDYSDVKQGRDHQSTVFLHPSTVERHGMPVAVHVEISVDGKVVDVKDDLDSSIRGTNFPVEDWWNNRQLMENPNLKVRDGYLMMRPATPFWLVNSDDFEVIR
ncbi:MAG: hypothetical protein O3A51_09160 [Verrucomicrobia bacterium]|nr:hypothetical protein [Verrucomicrobiota bacterium]